MKIMVCTDGSVGAANTGQLLAELPLALPVALTTVSVCRPLPSAIRNWLNKQGDSEFLREAFRSSQLEWARANTAQTLENLDRKGWIKEARVLEGGVSETLLYMARERRIDLVVAGAAGTNPSRALQLGTVSRRLSRFAPCSVLLCRGPGRSNSLRPKPFKIVWAYDGSENGKEVIRFLQSYFAFGANVSLIVVRVIGAIRLHPLGPMAEKIFRDVQRADRRAAKKDLKSIERILTEFAKSVKVDTQIGQPFQRIMETVEELEPDLLITGALGTSNIRKFQIGSVTNRLAHHAPCSILIVRGANERPPRKQLATDKEEAVLSTLI